MRRIEKREFMEKNGKGKKILMILAKKKNKATVIVKIKHEENLKKSICV